MTDLNLRRWTGAFGLGAGVLILLAIGLYLAAGSAPRIEDAAKFSDYVTKNNSLILTTTVVDALNAACFIVFLAGLRHLIRQARPDQEWVATLVFGAGLIDAALSLVFDALLGAAALDTVNKAEPIVVRALAEGSTLIISSVGLVVRALFLSASGYAIVASSAVPRWTGWVAAAAAVLNLAAVPTIYRGTDLSGFYTAGGYAPFVLGILPYVAWLFVLGISLVVGQPRAIVSREP
jgi:hypothetical protein